MTLRNDRRIGVRNGNRGVVVAVDPDAHTMRVRLTRGDIDLPARYLDAGHVGHAYAMTVNKAHGLTCDRTMTLGDDQIYRELAYEALSRGRLSNHVYIPRSCIDLDQELPHARTVDSPEPMELLEQGLRRSHAKQLALDQMATVPLQAWTTGDLLAERDASAASSTRPRQTGAVTSTPSSRHGERPVSELKQADFDVARLECRNRPLRDRRKPDVELIHANTSAVQVRTGSSCSTTRSPGSRPASTDGAATSPPTEPTPSNSTSSTACSPNASAPPSSATSPTRPATSPEPRSTTDRPTARPRMGQGGRRDRHLPRSSTTSPTAAPPSVRSQPTSPPNSTGTSVRDKIGRRPGPTRDRNPERATTRRAQDRATRPRHRPVTALPPGVRLRIKLGSARPTNTSRHRSRGSSDGCDTPSRDRLFAGPLCVSEPPGSTGGAGLPGAGRRDGGLTVGVGLVGVGEPFGVGPPSERLGLVPCRVRTGERAAVSPGWSLLCGSRWVVHQNQVVDVLIGCGSPAGPVPRRLPSSRRVAR